MRSRRHPAGCAHCEAVRRIAAAYWLWRQTAESAREAACYGYRTEEREYGALPTFRDYLIQTAGERAAYERALELEKEGAA